MLRRFLSTIIAIIATAATTTAAFSIAADTTNEISDITTDITESTSSDQTEPTSIETEETTKSTNSGHEIIYDSLPEIGTRFRTFSKVTIFDVTKEGVTNYTYTAEPLTEMYAIRNFSISGMCYVYIPGQESGHLQVADFSQLLSPAYGIEILEHDALYVGDLTKDARVDVFDMVVLRTILVNGDSEDSEKFVRADVNMDGKVNVADAVLLQHFLLGRKKSFW